MGFARLNPSYALPRTANCPLPIAQQTFAPTVTIEAGESKWQAASRRG